MSQAVVEIQPMPSAARFASITLKALLVGMLFLALVYPDSSNMRDKGAGVRAIVYPALAFTIPVLWWTQWRERMSFPWLADLLVTITCFTDILGNRLDLYDTVVWFDDWMHFMNTGLLAVAVVLISLPHDASLGRIVERCLAVGATGAIVWEIGEFFAFISNSSEREFAYADTLGDLGLGVLGAVCGGFVVHWVWRRSGQRVQVTNT